MRIKAGFIAFAITLTSGASMADTIEEPQWQLIEQLEAVEIRQYQARIQATTTMPSSSANSAAFRRLAGYIFGGNDTGESIAMTAPVQTTLNADNPVMAFNMPASFEMQELPQPDNQAIAFASVPAQTVAALRFSGWATDGKVERKTVELMDALEQHGVQVEGEPVLNQYNPPWTLINRRNEIMVAVATQTRAL
jgi:hypothetical protein